MVNLNAKITRVGHSYGILIPKALIECGVLDQGEEYIFEIKKKPLKKKEDFTRLNNAGEIYSRQIISINNINYPVEIILKKELEILERGDRLN